MIAQTFQDAFSPQWIKMHLPNATHDLILLHHIIPWQSIIERLTPFYNPQKGRSGHSLRILVATSILCRLRQLSDVFRRHHAGVVWTIGEHHYYFAANGFGRVLHCQ